MAVDKLHLLKWLYIAGGLWCLFGGLIAAVAICCLWLTWVLEFMAGIAFILYGANTVTRPGARPNPSLPWLFIACLINCDFVAALFGIVILIIQSSPEVKLYYEELGRQPYYIR